MEDKGDLNIVEIKGMPEQQVLDDIFGLYMEVIDRPGKDYFYERIGKYPELYTLLAYKGEQLAGFKMGYCIEPGIFYSWLGGVKAPFRRQGIARRMMTVQHNFLKNENYAIIRTKTKNIYRNMLVLNILSGFDIIDSYTDKFGDPKIVMEKNQGRL